MNLPDQILLALKNILRAGTKTVLCVLAVSIGISSVSLIISLGSATGASVQAELQQIGVRGIAIYTSNGEPISEASMQVLAQTEGIEASMPLILTSGSVKLRNEVSAAGILGIDHHLDQVFQVTVLHGALPKRGQVIAGEKITVIDEELAQKAYHRSNVVGKDLWISVNGISEKLKICAVIRSQSAGVSALLGGNIPHILYLPHTTLSTLSSDLKTDKAVIISNNGNDTQLPEKLVRRLTRLSGIPYAYENLDHYFDSFSKITFIVTVLISGVAAISLFVGGLGMMNTMIASVDSRTREIGIYRALGAKRRDIIRVFLIESVLLCLIGGLFGLALSGGVFLVIRMILEYPLDLHRDGVLIGLATAGLCGLSFGWLPAVRAANLDPIRAIRSE